MVMPMVQVGPVFMVIYLTCVQLTLSMIAVPVSTAIHGGTAAVNAKSNRSHPVHLFVELNRLIVIVDLFFVAAMMSSNRLFC